MRFLLLFVITVLFAGCSNFEPSVSGSKQSESSRLETNSQPDSSLLNSNDGVRIDTVRYINYSEDALVVDLNGDGFPEVVSKVAEPKMNRIGVRVLDGKKSDRFTVFGAGNEVDGMINLRWIGSMKLIPKGETIASTLVDVETGDIIGPDSTNQVLLQNPAVLFLAKDTHGGGILYWTGTEYAWMHLE